jgi:hypothetical protein
MCVDQRSNNGAQEPKQKIKRLPSMLKKWSFYWLLKIFQDKKIGGKRIKIKKLKLDIQI